jgi:hypothetical protein
VSGEILAVSSSVSSVREGGEAGSTGAGSAMRARSAAISPPARPSAADPA